MSETTTTKAAPRARKIPPPVLEPPHPMAGLSVGPAEAGITAVSIDGVEFDVDPTTGTIIGLRA